VNGDIKPTNEPEFFCHAKARDEPVLFISLVGLLNARSEQELEILFAASLEVAGGEFPMDTKCLTGSGEELHARRAALLQKYKLANWEIRRWP
jgi:hypothetical protein